MSPISKKRKPRKRKVTSSQLLIKLSPLIAFVVFVLLLTKVPISLGSRKYHTGQLLGTLLARNVAQDFETQTTYDNMNSGTLGTNSTVASSDQSPTSPTSETSSTSSPFVDLVSSNKTQTTTPFTTSLSTALLPNVSSHAYAPTAPPSNQVGPSSSALVSSSQAQVIKFSSTTHKPNPSDVTFEVSSPATSSSSSVSTPQSGSLSVGSSAADSSSTFSQLYSNQHSNSNQHDKKNNNNNNEQTLVAVPAILPYIHHPQQSRPQSPVILSNLASLQAASKIFASSSSSNNLIPGLTGLHSAILSHIPFKVASGLSYGLANYMQAAIKPTGTRPLFSSNNSPSLQYLQQMQANATKQQPQVSTTPAITTLAPSSVSAVRFLNGTSSGAIEYPESNFEVSSTVATTTQAPSSVTTLLFHSTSPTSTTTTHSPSNDTSTSVSSSSSSQSIYEFKHENGSSTVLGPTFSQYQYQSHVSESQQPDTSILSYSAPFVDLVSSNSAQTTTPFTISLSTALLPNISSHPYAPTAPPSVQVTSTPLVPSPVQESKSTSQKPPQPTRNSSSEYATTSSESGPSSSPLSSSSSSSSSPSSPAPIIPAVVDSSSTFSQLYSNQHSNSNSIQHNELPPVLGSHIHHHQQPQQRPQSSMILSNLAGLHAASKIVTGSSSSNNLIPSLSGLQSAILSHIPFKIAAGLTNYMQAAMKPTGTRPLFSSNNAPSLQYLQQMQANATKQQQQVASVAASSTVPPSSGFRFPISTSSAAPELAESNSSIVLSSVATTSAPSLSSVSTWLIQTTSAASTSTTATPLMSVLDSYDIVKEAQLVCGRPQVNQGAGESKKRVARIVGGNQSLFGQWPWMVSLRQWRKGAFLHKCGAALLNENWAITAAHCVENVKVNDLLLRLGEFDVSNQEEPYPYIERRVKSVVSHPLFDPKTFEYDLALIRFAEPIKYERNIIPVCVPNGNDSYVDRMATVIGWGRLYEDGPLPDVIQHVDVPIITNRECERMYKNAGYIEEIPEMFICAGISKGGRDSCEGDSGGPLTMVDHDGRSYLVGIISWGIGCALPSQPGVYTRITAFSGWINQITAY